MYFMILVQAHLLPEFQVPHRCPKWIDVSSAATSQRTDEQCGA